MKSLLRSLHDRSPAVQHLVRRYYASTRYADWKTIVARDSEGWARARDGANGPRVLVATGVGAFRPGTTLESLLAAALTLRGARVETLLCDAALPACMEALHAWRAEPPQAQLTRSLCADCTAPAAATLAPLGLPARRYGEWLDAHDREHAEAVARDLPLADIAGWRWEGIDVGQHALAGALRYFARGTLEGEPAGELVLRSYLRAAVLTTAMSRRLFDTVPFDVVLLHHGIYVPQGLVLQVARSRGVRVVTWNPGSRRGRFLFSHDDTYHHTMMDEPVAAWESLPWTPAIDAALLAYLGSRRRGSEDWISFQDAPREEFAAVEAAVGGMPAGTRARIGLLTNVVWDAQLHYPNRAFPDMLAWIKATIEHFAARPELQLVIRVHPGEVLSRIASRQPVVDEVRRAFPTLPANVVIVPPDNRLSTYTLMQTCNAALIYGTKTGVELTSLGLPVIVAGEAWIRNKGLTFDADDAAGYERLLQRLPFASRLTDEQVLRARRYAFHFFFRRMIPVRSIRPAAGRPLYRLDVESFDALRPGVDPGLDVICEGLLRGTPFVFPAEQWIDGPTAAPIGASPAARSLAASSSFVPAPSRDAPRQGALRP